MPGPHEFLPADIREEGDLIRAKKLLSIYYKHKPGGLCKRLYMLFHAWVEEGGEVHYIGVEPYPTSHPRIIPHILWTPFSKNEGLLFWIYFILVAPFYSFFVGVRLKVDIISVFGGLYGFIASFAKVLLNKPMIAFIRSDVREAGRILHRPRLLILLEDFFVGLGFRLSDRLVTVNQHLKEMIAARYRIDPNTIHILRNDIRPLPHRDLSKEICREKFDLKPTDFVVATMSVLDSKKNVEVFIKAGGLLDCSATFLIIGDGPERANLERLANRLEGKARFVFTGWQEDVSIILSTADLFVLPSKQEGCSNALLEALAHGLPCLGSDIPAIKEVLHSERILFAPNEAETLAEKIAQSVKNPHFLDEIKEISEESRKRFVFDWEKTILQHHVEMVYPSID